MGAALFYWDLEVATSIICVGCEAGWVGAALFYWDLEVDSSILSVGCEAGGGCSIILLGSGGCYLYSLCRL